MTGTINGGGNYRFMLTCVDGDQPGGDGADTFRIRIWSDSGGLVYDNQLNAASFPLWATKRPALYRSRLA